MAGDWDLVREIRVAADLYERAARVSREAADRIEGLLTLTSEDVARRAASDDDRTGQLHAMMDRVSKVTIAPDAGPLGAALYNALVWVVTGQDGGGE